MYVVDDAPLVTEFSGRALLDRIARLCEFEERKTLLFRTVSRIVLLSCMVASPYHQVLFFHSSLIIYLMPDRSPESFSLAGPPNMMLALLDSNSLQLPRPRLELFFNSAVGA